MQTTPAPTAGTTAPAETAPTDPTATTAQQAGDTSDPSAAQMTEPQATEPQAASASQIAQIVNAEFPTYAKTSQSELTKGEFGQWMVALRSASEPGVNAQSAEVRTWTDQAFASADTDQSGKVTKTELTTFLSQGPS